jgi:hypothetical protein
MVARTLRELDGEIKTAEREKKRAVEVEDYDLAKILKRKLLDLKSKREALAADTKAAKHVSKPEGCGAGEENGGRAKMAASLLVVVVAMVCYLVFGSSEAEGEEEKSPPAFTFARGDYQCDIDVRDLHSLSEEEFLNEYWKRQKPVLIHAPQMNWRAREKWSSEWILKQHGAHPVELGDPYATNVWKMKKQRTAVRTFYDKMDEFDKTGQYLWSGTLLKRYPSKPERIRDNTTMESDWRRIPFLHHPELGFEDLQTQIVVGGNGTGLGFHFHKDGFNEVVMGNKRWWFYPKEQYVPYYNRYKRHVDWVAQVLPQLDEKEKPLYCLQPPGTIMYVPELWNHATINDGRTLCVIQNREYARPNGYLHNLQQAQHMLSGFERAKRQPKAQSEVQMNTEKAAGREAAADAIGAKAAAEEAALMAAAAATAVEAVAAAGETWDVDYEYEEYEEEPPECVLDCEGIPIHEGAQISDWCKWAREDVAWQTDECVQDCELETISAMEDWANDCAELANETVAIKAEAGAVKVGVLQGLPFVDDGSAGNPHRIKDIFALLNKARAQERQHAEVWWMSMMVLQNTAGQNKEFHKLHRASLAAHCDHYPKLKDDCRAFLATGKLTLFG